MKNKIYTLSLFCVVIFSCNYYCFSQVGEWVWIKGTTAVNNVGNYGTQGVTTPTNNPPSLAAAFEWKDLNGNFWLFGGRNTFMNVYADLWKYEPSANQWTWMKGTHQTYWSGNYGTQGVSAPTNNPSCRHDGAAWTDNQGNLWLFGGVQSAGVYYSDLWKFDISLNEWVWVKGPNTPAQPGVYGTQGVPSSLNIPSARYSCTATWTDNSGDLWLFGGNGGNILNDLWRYNITSNQWTWMKGSQSFNPPAVLGIKGIEDSLNVPGGRSVNARWKDVNGIFWIFGGLVNGATVTNQLWRFNPVTNNWTWMSGDSTNNSFGLNGTVCIDSSSNKPAAFRESRATWSDSFGNLLFYGGAGNNGAYSDFWKYCLSTNHWTLQRPNGAVNWGTLGVSSPTNTPGYRFASNSSKDNNGNLYLFGGSSPLGQSYGDLWKFIVDSACGTCIPTVSIPEINYQNMQLMIYPNPIREKFTIKFSEVINNGRISISNLYGEKLFEDYVYKADKKEINLKNITGGIYFVKVFDGEKYCCRKIVID